MKISVITPAYNAQDFIQLTLESVLNAEIGWDFEYILINDGSTDRSYQIWENFEPRLRVLNKPNGGEASAVNLGICNAIGDYILVVNSDDPVIDIETLIRDSITIMENDVQVVACYPDWQKIDSSNDVLKVIRTLDFDRKLLIEQGRCLPGPGAIFRASSAKEIAGRDPQWKYMGDYDFWLRLSSLGDFKRIPKVLASWRSHSNSLTYSGDGKRKAFESIEVMKNFLNIYNPDGIDRKIALSYAYLKASLVCIESKLLYVQTYFINAIVLNPKILREIKIRTSMYIVFYPLSRCLLKLFNKLSNLSSQSTSQKE